jgi:hypothetical protein
MSLAAIVRALNASKGGRTPEEWGGPFQWN